MSSTGRGGKRSPADYYPTPAWCVRRLLEEVELPGGVWVEPCAGDGAIIHAVNAVRGDVEWQANELRKECRGDLCSAIGRPDRVHIGDIDSFMPSPAPVVAITNPPFSAAMEVVNWCRLHADITVLLLRLNFLASAQRAPFMRANAPDIYVLPIIPPSLPSMAGSSGHKRV
ncbi:MAG: hypothetical protein HN348_35860 [Proteobacteria bacterium]|jgi:hypothetical protein|nr:hypothetical protein [Pseudomonadota bacterium]